jgi:hypothetical protein
MTLKTLGTNANNSLSAVQFGPNGVLSDSDLAAFNALVQPDYGGTNPNNGKLGTYVSREGQFFIPNRGWVMVFSGDWLCVDSTTGFPFILSKNAVASGPYTHS